MLEINQIACFLAIIEEQSFSRAATRLGLAQSAVSQKMKRLEDQLGLRLLERTSRQIRLSRHGTEFLPFARAMIEAEAQASTIAREMRSRLNKTLLLGGYNFLIEERLALVAHFLNLYPHYEVEVYHGTREDLRNALMQGKIDAWMALAYPDKRLSEFDHQMIGRRVAHFALPLNHPLAQRTSLELADLAGMEMAISPGRQDAPILNSVCVILAKKGIKLTPAPEADRRSIVQFARSRGLPRLQWYLEHKARHETATEAILPIENNRLFTDLIVYFKPELQNEIVRCFTESVKGYVETSSDPFAGA